MYIATVNLAASGSGVVADGVTLDTGALQAAINNAAPNTRLYLPPGVIKYAYPLTLKSAVELVGRGPRKTILQQTDPNLSGLVVAPDAVDWMVEGMTIAGTRPTGSTQGPNAVLQTTRGGRGQVRDILLRDASGMGLQVAGSTDCLFERVEVTNIGLHGVWLGWSAVNVSASYAKRNTFKGLRVSYTDLDGVEVHADTVFEDVTLTNTGVNYGPGAGGLFVLAAPDKVGYRVKLVRCFSRASGVSGFDIGQGASEISMTDCEAQDNAVAGFSFAGNNCRLVGFRAYGNGTKPSVPARGGVFIGSPGGAAVCHSNVIAGGIIAYNAGYAVDILDASTFPGYGSCPTGNVVQGVRAYGNAGGYRVASPGSPAALSNTVILS